MTWTIDHEAPNEYVLVTIVTKPDKADPIINVYAGEADKPWDRAEATRRKHDSEFDALTFDAGVRIEHVIRKVHRAKGPMEQLMVCEICEKEFSQYPEMRGKPWCKKCQDEFDQIDWDKLHDERYH